MRLRNDGRQLHEIKLVELPAGNTVDERRRLVPPAGRTPADDLLSGVVVRPGNEGATTLELKSGTTYAFICAIPDVLGDFAPHITKGMFSSAFSVR